jgi:DNA replication protein DnaC
MSELLVLDDLGAERETAWSASVLFMLLDRRYREFKPTVVSSNLMPAEISDRMGDRVASRLAAGAGVLLDGPDRRLGGQGGLW